VEAYIYNISTTRVGFLGVCRLRTAKTERPEFERGRSLGRCPWSTRGNARATVGSGAGRNRYRRKTTAVFKVSLNLKPKRVTEPNRL